MGMTIEQIIKYLNAPICADTVISKEKQKEYEAHDSAVIIMCKYQKIQEIYQWAKDRSYLVETDDIMDKLKEVVEDGND